MDINQTLTNQSVFKSLNVKNINKAGLKAVTAGIAATGALVSANAITNSPVDGKTKIRELEDKFNRMLLTPPQTRDLVDWGYYQIGLDRLRQQIDELKKQYPLDKTNIEEVLASKPSEIFAPKKADNIKGLGISFLQNIPEDKEFIDKNSYLAVPIFTNARTVEEMIRIGKRDGLNIELIPDKDNNLRAGIKNIWNKDEYFNIDRDSVAMKYGKQSAADDYVDQTWAQNNKDENNQIDDVAVVANDKNNLEILSKSYVHKDGTPIKQSDMHNWNGFKVHKDGNAIVNAVAFDSPKKLQTLEGEIETDVTMGDVEGYVYNNFKQLKKQIIPDKNGYSKLKANPNDKNSAKFIELIKAGKDDEALELLRKATRDSMQK